MPLYPVAGLPVPIELPVPLVIDLIPRSQTMQRPGIPRDTPGYYIQHETANYNTGADAEMHNRYLHNGAQGQYLSFHFAVDDGVIYQMIPVTEVTWQAADGSGPGNMSGISCELCVNQDANWTVARHNAEALAGGVMKALGMGIDRLKRHYDFNAADPDRHYCPKEMMTSGYWATFVSNVGTIIGGSVQSMYPDGMDRGIAERLFGKVVLDGKTYQFNPDGSVSKRWLEHGKATHDWSPLTEVWTYADGRTYFRFRSGWVVYRPAGGGYVTL